MCVHTSKEATYSHPRKRHCGSESVRRERSSERMNYLTRLLIMQKDQAWILVAKYRYVEGPPFDPYFVRVLFSTISTWAVSKTATFHPLPTHAHTHHHRHRTLRAHSAPPTHALYTHIHMHRDAVASEAACTPCLRYRQHWCNSPG